MHFQLAQGVLIDDISTLEQAYCREGENITASLSCENILEYISAAVAAFDEPMFFFLELTCSEDEEKVLRKSKTDAFHYNLYYLDNCTSEVIKAIVKRYGNLLMNDGLSRFGFGSHESGSEIYVQRYKVIGLYSPIEKVLTNAEKCFARLGVTKTDALVTPWELLSDENVGHLTMVEIDGETVFDIPVNLEDAGMYLADTIE